MLSRSLPRHGAGGMELVAWDLAREFARSGRAVRLVTTTVPGRPGDYEDEGVRVSPLRGTPPGRYSSAWWSASRDYFRQHCLATTGAVLSVSAAGFGLLGIKARLPGVPFIMQAHGTSWGELVSKWRTPRAGAALRSLRNLAWLPRDLLAYRRFDAVVAVGDRVYRDLSRPPASWALRADRLHLIDNGVDTRLFRYSDEARLRVRTRLGIGPDALVVLSASRLHPQKGVDQGLLAFSVVRKRAPEAEYLIVGDGPDRGRLETLAKRAGIDAHVRFVGEASHEVIPEYYQAADVLLFLTDAVEGLPLNVLESLASGLPVVMSDHVGIAVDSGIARVSRRDLDAIADAVVAAGHARSAPRASLVPARFTLAEASRKYLMLVDTLISAMAR